jgi:large subunit ribosomal protein L6
MSRIGKQPVPVPGGVKVAVAGQVINVEGPKGKLLFKMADGVSAAFDPEKKQVLVKRASDSRSHKELHGMTRSLIFNMVKGVTEGYVRRLEIVGVGFNAKVQGKDLLLTVGFVNPVKLAIPAGLAVTTPAPTAIVIQGPDKQMVGEFAAVVRRVKPPEPYKGKGIRYEGEQVRRKAGKAFVATE